MTDKKATALEIKSTRMDVLVVALKSMDVELINDALFKRFNKITDAASVPLLIDFSRFDVTIQSSITNILPIFKHYGLNVIGLRHHDKSFEAIATAHKLAFNKISARSNTTSDHTDAPEEILQKTANNAKQTDTETESQKNITLPEQNHPNGKDIKSSKAKQEEETPETSAPEPLPTAVPQQKPAMIVTRPVRTGQQIYAKDTDLILLNLVSAGAEVLADGNIHVYAPLRGKAMAGVKGNRQARIFTQCMQAELVSIAGKYRAIDQGLPQDIANKPAQIYIEQDKLMITALK
jgi:septum site-determining protein MinC